MKSPLSQSEQQFVEEAAEYLEKPSLLIRIADTLGKPIDWAQKQLPKSTQKAIAKAVNQAITKAMQAALITIPRKRARSDDRDRLADTRVSERIHLITTGAAGGLSGFFGDLAIWIELPITTTLMLRSIAEIAKANAFDLTRPEIQLECMYIFALGTPAKSDDLADGGYYASRVAFGQMIGVASRFIEQHTSQEVLRAVEKGTAPSILRFITAVAERFEVTVTEKFLGQAIPILGAAGGAAINTLFTNHYNCVARYHFGLRRLEAKYGDVVSRIYGNVAARRGGKEG